MMLESLELLRNARDWMIHQAEDSAWIWVEGKVAVREDAHGVWVWRPLYPQHLVEHSRLAAVVVAYVEEAVGPIKTQVGARS